MGIMIQRKDRYMVQMVKLVVLLPFILVLILPISLYYGLKEVIPELVEQVSYVISGNYK
jgi:hypothetical protein